MARSWRSVSALALMVGASYAIPMFTPGQVSDMLDIPPSTLRRYVKDFETHLSDSAKKQRGRRFSEEDISLIARARELLQQGRTPEETGKLLAVVIEEGEGEEAPDSALALVPSISKALTEALDVARALRAEVDDIQERMEQAEEQEGQLRAQQLETQVRLQQLEEWLAQPWYKRAFGKPPKRLESD